MRCTVCSFDNLSTVRYCGGCGRLLAGEAELSRKPLPDVFERLGKVRFLGWPAGADWAAFGIIVVLGALAFPLLWLMLHGAAKVETPPLALVDIEKKKPSVPPKAVTKTGSKGKKAKSKASKSAPSFDCRKASTAVEKEVCSNPTLASLDRRMVGAYQRLLLKTDPAGRNTIRTKQVAWFRRYSQNCNALAGNRDALGNCIHSYLIAREMELSSELK